MIEMKKHEKKWREMKSYWVLCIFANKIMYNSLSKSMFKEKENKYKKKKQKKQNMKWKYVKKMTTTPATKCCC